MYRNICNKVSVGNNCFGHQPFEKKSYLNDMSVPVHISYQQAIQKTILKELKNKKV